MRRLAILVVGLWVGFGWTAGASAVPIAYHLNPGVAVGSALIFTLYADDGVATAEDTSAAQPIPSGSITGDLSGVISPLFTIEQWTYSHSSVGLNFTIGTAEIPVALDLSVTFGWTPSSLNQITLGDSINVDTGSVNELDLSGILATPFGDLPFDLDANHLFPGDTSLRYVLSGNCSGAPLVGLSFDDTNTLTSDGSKYGGCSGQHRLVTPAKATLGEIGGVSWTLGMQVNYDSTAYAVPEPSTALLLGLGLVGIAARRRV